MGFFSEELSPEQRLRILERRVELLIKAEEHLWDSAMFAISKIHAITLALEGGGIVEAGELEEMRVKTLEALKCLERARGNGR